MEISYSLQCFSNASFVSVDSEILIWIFANKNKKDIRFVLVPRAAGNEKMHLIKNQMFCKLYFC